MNQGKVRFECRQERIFSASNFVFFFFSHSEPDSTERELSERHGGIAGGEALHSSLHPFPRRRRPNMSEFGANYQRHYTWPTTAVLTLSITLCTRLHSEVGNSSWNTHLGKLGNKWHIEYSTKPQ